MKETRPDDEKTTKLPDPQTTKLGEDEPPPRDPAPPDIPVEN